MTKGMAVSRSLSILQLLHRSAEGWTASHHGLATELIQIWKDLLKAPVEIQDNGDGWSHFCTDLSGIRLRGMDEVPCLLLAPPSDTKKILENFRLTATPGRLGFILTLSDDQFHEASAYVGNGRCLVFSPSHLKRILGSDRPRAVLNEILREQLPLHWLIPYNYLLPAQGNMFFGRKTELNMLLHEEDVSFAIAGPSRMGKTSLVKQHLRTLAAIRDPRSTRAQEIDFYTCKDTSSDGVARFLAMKIDSSRRSHRMTAEGIVDFLRYHRGNLGGPLELILDEVDEVCQGRTFEYIGDAAKRGYCRLIFCGRGRLLRMMLSKESPLACRLELLRPGPLDADAARQLLLEPLSNLGITVKDPDKIASEVFRWTGRLPHLLQFYGKKLSELAGGNREVSHSEVKDLHWDFETAQFFTSPLSDLDDEETRNLALAILKEGCPHINVADAQRLSKKYSSASSHRRTLENLNDLVVCNILRWEKGCFYVANEALPAYAERLGYLKEGAPEKPPEITKDKGIHAAIR